MEIVKGIMSDPNVQSWIQTGVISLIGMVFAWLNSKATAAKVEADSHLTKEFKKKDIQATIQRAVFAVGQTSGKTFKEAAADGKITKEEKKVLFEEAVTKVKEELSKEAHAFIASEYPSYEGFIKNSIEAAYVVYKAMKSGKNPLGAGVKKN